MTIRGLRPGEPTPTGAPKRYPDRDGYIRLRWRVGKNQHVEAREHRLVAEARLGDQVHHRDGQKANNAPENLEILSLSEHGERHAHRKFDVQRAADLHAAGLSTPEIGRALGVDPSNIWRGLNRAGFHIRSMKEAGKLRRARLDTDEVLRLARQGVRVRAIAKQLGVSTVPIARILREAGFPAFPPGRPPS